MLSLHRGSCIIHSVAASLGELGGEPTTVEQRRSSVFILTAQMQKNTIPPLTRGSEAHRSLAQVFSGDITRDYEGRSITASAC